MENNKKGGGFMRQYLGLMLSLMCMPVYVLGMHSNESIQVTLYESERSTTITKLQLAELQSISQYVSDLVESIDGEIQQLYLPNGVDPESFSFILKNAKTIQALLLHPHDEYASNQLAAAAKQMFYSQTGDEIFKWNYHGQCLVNLLRAADALLIENNSIAAVLQDEFWTSYQKAIEQENGKLVEDLRYIAGTDELISKAVNSKVKEQMPSYLTQLWALKPKQLPIQTIMSLGKVLSIQFDEEDLDTLIFTIRNDNITKQYKIKLLWNTFKITELDQPGVASTVSEDHLIDSLISPCGTYVVGREVIPGQQKWKAILWNKKKFPYHKESEINAPQSSPHWEVCEFEKALWSPDSKKVAIVWRFPKKNKNKFALQIYNVDQKKWTLVKDNLHLKAALRYVNLAQLAWSPDSSALCFHSKTFASEYPGMFDLNQKDSNIRRFNVPKRIITCEHRANSRNMLIGPVCHYVVCMQLDGSVARFGFIDTTVPMYSHLSLKTFKISDVTQADFNSLVSTWSKNGKKFAFLLGNRLILKTFCEKISADVIRDCLQKELDLSEKLDLFEVFCKKSDLPSDINKKLQQKLGLIELPKNELTNNSTTTTTITTSDLTEPAAKRQRLN